MVFGLRYTDEPVAEIVPNTQPIRSPSGRSSGWSAGLAGMPHRAPSVLGASKSRIPASHQALPQGTPPPAYRTRISRETLHGGGGRRSQPFSA